MIKALLLSLLLIPYTLFAQDSLKEQLGGFIDDWHGDAARADIRAYFDKIDTEGIYIGTDATERWTKEEFYNWAQPYFNKGKAWSFKAVERNLFFARDSTVAWFDEKLETSSGMLRGSGVLQLNHGGWKIMQYVLSLPIPNDKFKDVKRVISQ
jgi:hypothetical protein